MVSRCANPSCDARFKYLREGRLFQFRAADPESGLVSGSGAVELWWLCARCCSSMTLVADGAGVKLIPLRDSENPRPGEELGRTGAER